jgi:hypothetical protein
VPDPAPGIDVWYGSTQVFGAKGRAQPWVNVLGNVSDADGVAALGYRLNGGPLRSLSVGPDLRRLQEPGDFNIDIPTSELAVGANTVEIRLTDGNGQVQTESVTVRWLPATPASMLTVDWSGGHAGIDDAVQVVDGRWAITGGEAATVEIGYDRALAIGDVSWTDYEVTVPVRFLGFDDPGTPQSGAPLIGFGLRWQGHGVVAGAQPNWGFRGAGAYAWYQARPTSEGGPRIRVEGHDSDGNGQREPIVSFGMTLQQAQQYIFKARVDTIPGGARYQFKVWQQGQPEPAYQLSIEEPDGPSSGSILLLAHHFDVRFGDVTVTSV